LAVAIGREAINAGYTVLFASTPALVAQLARAQGEGRLEERLGHFSKPKLLIVDELGYLPFEPNAAHLFFQLVSRRYERGSMLITSNRAVGEWGTVFGDAVVATAILDRLLHHSHVLTIRGDSYRLREKRRSGLLKTGNEPEPQAKRAPQLHSNARWMNVIQSPHEVSNCPADLIGAILLNVVPTRDGDFCLVRPSPAKLASTPSQQAPGVRVDEQFRRRTLGQCLAIADDNRGDVGRLSLDRYLPRPCQGWPTPLTLFEERRPIRSHFRFRQRAQNSVWHILLNKQVLFQNQRFAGW